MPPTVEFGEFWVEKPEVEEVLDLRTGAVLRHDKAIGTDYEAVIKLRSALQESIQREEPLYACSMCRTPVYLVSQKRERRFFFRHTLEDDRCSAKTRGLLSQEEIDATRYSRMLKGKTDFSVLGIKLSLEPSSETIDELLDDIDDLLKQIDRRLIVIIDDLDRLESKLVNNVLFTVRRTFKLTQATYILCYDTETLVASAGGKDDGARAREFLEKFVTAKLSLFVDQEAIRDYLGSDWETKAIQSDTVSATARDQLKKLMTATKGLLAGKDGHRYGPMLGDMRKVKRFVNAVLLMRMDTVRLDGTDFEAKDLIHLMLLHLCYPGLFRRIYAEETEGRSGTFGAQRGAGEAKKGPLNGSGLEEAVKTADAPAQFLLRQLFDVESSEPSVASTVIVAGQNKAKAGSCPET